MLTWRSRYNCARFDWLSLFVGSLVGWKRNARPTGPNCSSALTWMSFRCFQYPIKLTYNCIKKRFNINLYNCRDAEPSYFRARGTELKMSWICCLGSHLKLSWTSVRTLGNRQFDFTLYFLAQRLFVLSQSPPRSQNCRRIRRGSASSFTNWPWDRRLRVRQYSSRSLDSIGLLKIDAEGFDLEVIKGARETLSSRRVRFVMVEVGFHPGDDRHPLFDEVRNTLMEHGFYVFGIYNQSMEQSGEPRVRFANVLFCHDAAAGPSP
jgi:Methyltransferase FkbM domain